MAIPGVLTLAGALALLSLASLYLPLPLREPGRWAWFAVAAWDQFLVLLLLGAWILGVHPVRPTPSWPVSPGLAHWVRGLGVWCGLVAVLGAVALLQYAVVWLQSDLEAAVALHPDPERLDGAYGWLTLTLAVYGLILTAWAQVLLLVLRPGMAVLALMTLVFTGFLLPRLTDLHPAMTPLVALLPDLRTLIPDRPLQKHSLSVFPYALLHAAALWALGSVILAIKRDRGASR